jgi:hypothetical protein
MDKWFRGHYDIIQDKNVNDKEIKLFCILELLYHEDISLHKAQELCTEVGLFSDHWMVVDAKIMDIWQDYYKE